MHECYQKYFNIDPKYYAAVTADLIKSGQVRWESFYPHESFVNLLEKVDIMLSGKDTRSIWIEGAYGTGKSHAALTIKSMLDASDDEVRAYFQDYGLDMNLCQKLITDKNAGQLITVHRIGSASIHSDQDLILAIQDSIVEALENHGIQNKGEASLKESALKWFDEKQANREYFDKLIQEPKYYYDFVGKHIDEVIDDLRNSSGINAENIMKKILRVAEDNGISALRMDVEDTCKWIKNIIQENHLSAIVFIWDEFTEYFYNNINSLTGFQTLIELSESSPFYFMIVTHESGALIEDAKQRKKIMDRFVGGTTIRIDLPDNMAFRLMANSMKITDDPVLSNDWKDYKSELNYDLEETRKIIVADSAKHSTLGKKTQLNDNDLQGVVPIHPYAALLLKHMSVTFQSNARSMFDFIISNDMNEAKGFKWYISKYGPTDENYNLLTIDMLWDFFTGKNQSGLTDNVRIILDSYNVLKPGSLTPDEERVFKTILLLEAVSQQVQNVDLLRPNEANLELAFNGLDWQKGKAKHIADGLIRKGYLFENPVGRGMNEYTVANLGGNKANIEKIKAEIRGKLNTQKLIDEAHLMDSTTNPAIQLPASIHDRYIIHSASAANFTQETKKLKNEEKPNRFNTIAVFAINEMEEKKATEEIQKAVRDPQNDLIYIQSLVPMGTDLLDQYIESAAYCIYYEKSDKQRSEGYGKQAQGILDEWRSRITTGTYMIYSTDILNGKRATGISALQEELKKIDLQVYTCGLENYNLTDNMFKNTAPAQGAECGINQELKGTFGSSNANTKLSTNLSEVWKVDKYWEDPTKKSLPIVQIKLKVDHLMQEGMKDNADGVSILSVFEEMEKAPFGFIPSNVSAFVMGFVLKEYASSQYYWSNRSYSGPMSVSKLKIMIANAIKQANIHDPKYKEEYIREMSPEQEAFLQCTSYAFHIPLESCGSVESARDQVRIKMKGLMFPIWCLKYILDSEEIKSSTDQISQIIDDYCGIANTANGSAQSVAGQADKIGRSVLENSNIKTDLQHLLTSEKCRKGMISYIDKFKDGLLPALAKKIGDNGAYLDRVKEKFNDDSNWVWNSDTVDEIIDSVILDYQIIDESNRILNKCTKIEETQNEWNRRTNNIKISYDAMRKSSGDLSPFLEQLCLLKKDGEIKVQNKKRFYDLLQTQSESFEHFYYNQVPMFKQVEASFLEKMDESDVEDFYQKLSSGQFTKSRSQYDKDIEEEIAEYLKGKKKNQLKEIWRKKTNTKSPADWSDRYTTPILCLFNDEQRGEAKRMFDIVQSSYATDEDIEKAISWLENANFYSDLNDSFYRDRCFMERIVGDYSILLPDVDEIRQNLRNSVNDRVYDWMDNTTIQNRLKILADKKYRTTGYEKAKAVIENMNAEELRVYLNDLIFDNMKVGMEILKKG